MVEFFLNANFLKFVVSLLIYVSLNISRMLLCKGMTMVFWSYLTVPEFEYSGTCKYSGDLVLPKIPKYTDPNRIVRQFESALDQHWNAIKRHIHSMLERVRCGRSCWWRCGFRCLGLCCVPCTMAADACDDRKSSCHEQCSVWTARLYVLIWGLKRADAPAHDTEEDGHTSPQWNMDKVYEVGGRDDLSNERNELLRDENSKTPSEASSVALSEGEVVRSLLRRGLRRYELEGYAYIVAAVMVNVPWIVISRAVSGQINYQ